MNWILVNYSRFTFVCDYMFFCLDTKEPKNQGCIGLCNCS